LKSHLLIILFASLLFTSQYTKAQDVLQITGRIIDGNTGIDISNANIVNLKKRSVFLSDTAGFFSLTLLRSDILRISALGYETEYIAYVDTNITGRNIQIVKMTPKIYNISEVDIYAARWKDFEFEFKHTEFKNDPQQNRMEDWFYAVISEEELKMLTASASVGIPIPYTNSSEKQYQKIAELEKREADYNLVNLKFNRELVAETTNLPEAEIEDFMEFCGFTRPFILSSNKYDIIVAIKKRFLAYQKTQTPGF